MILLVPKTGTLITADGSEDELIKPEGLLGYIFLPPSVFFAFVLIGVHSIQ